VLPWGRGPEAGDRSQVWSRFSLKVGAYPRFPPVRASGKSGWKGERRHELANGSGGQAGDLIGTRFEARDNSRPGDQTVPERGSPPPLGDSRTRSSAETGLARRTEEEIVV